MLQPVPAILIWSSLFAILGAAAGVWLSEVHRIARRLVPLSGAALLALSLFWILPELGQVLGWTTGAALILAGSTVLWLVDRFVHPVCPSCSHSHDHDTCSTRLHGFATPLIAAALVHSVFDGWMLVAGEGHATEALSLGILLHRLPESLAYGVMLRAALRTRTHALLWALAAQAAALVGAAAELFAAPYLGIRALTVALALGGGTFLFLGFHAVHGEWKRRGHRVHAHG